MKNLDVWSEIQLEIEGENPIKRFIRQNSWRVKKWFRNIMVFGFRSSIVSDIQCPIVNKFKLVHYGLGTVVGSPVRIGKNVLIYQCVNIAGKVKVEDNVVINPHVVIYNKKNEYITIGHDSIIGSFSYVDKDVSPFSKIIQKPCKRE